MDIAGLRKQALQAKKLTGKSIASQFAEICRLRLLPGQLGAAEYYTYRLFDDAKYDWDAKCEFAGFRKEYAIDHQFNDTEWRAISNDKLIFYSTLHTLGIAHPKILAVLHEGGRGFAQAKQLNTVDKALEFLRSDATYPMFIKPVHGSFGRGAMSLMSYDQESDSVVLGDKDRIKLKDLFGAHSFNLGNGYLFQELLIPHPSFKEMFGHSLSGMRVVVFLTNSGPEIFRAVWKIPVGLNMSDNFDFGNSGNLVGAVDRQTGEVIRVISGTGFNLKEISKHPETQHHLLGIKIPDWDKVVSLCLTAAPLFPGLRFQSWDISICPEGPVPLEANVSGDLIMPQLAEGLGVFDKDMRRYMRELTV